MTVFLDTQTNHLALILYTIFIRLYVAGIQVASLWSQKARQWKKGRKNFPALSFNTPTIWMHCASLGEFEQGRPVLEACKHAFPTYPIIVSFFSPSGYEVRKNDSIADAVLYLPIDTPQHAKRLIKAINPAVVFWVKYDYWYHFLTTLQQQHIPVFLVSGIFRPNQPFFKWYGAFWNKMLHSFEVLFVQNEASKTLLEKHIKPKNIVVSGDTRFDRVLALTDKKEAVAHIDSFVTDAKVIVAGSTWEDDELLLIHYMKVHPAVKLIIAPHEIDRQNILSLQKEFNHAVLYSDWTKQAIVSVQPNVLIIDNVGMLSKLYKYADIAYVGGGFNSSGIHNTLEAAAYGKPVIFGPVYEKFAEAVALIETGGAFSIDNALELEGLLDKLFNNGVALQEAGKAARELVIQSKGATQKIIDYVAEKRLLTN
jgi:3-deoxy-D-manno-octulosonic-acid transferase